MRYAVVLALAMFPAIANSRILSSESEFSTSSNPWRTWAARAEIAPASRVDGRHSRGSSGALLLSGAGNPASSGGWQREITGVHPSKWYKLTVWYTAEGLTAESNQILCRLGWTDGKGKTAGQPDYAFQVATEGRWRRLTVTAPAPASAAAARIQLILHNAPGATVWWDDVQLEETDAPPPRTVRVSAVRLRPSRSSGPEENLRLFMDAVRKGGQAADLIVFPEGMTVVGTSKSYASVAEPVPGPSTDTLGKLARERKSWIVAGVYERDGKVLYNTAVLIDREGRFAGKYRKVYLPREEVDAGLTPGSEYPVFNTDFGKLGLMICWDVHYTDPARALALKGADIVALPIWGGNLTLTKARAIENSVFLVTSGYDIASMILDPKGETLASTEANATIAHAVIDLNRRYEWEWLGSMKGRFHREVRLDVAVAPGTIE